MPGPEEKTGSQRGRRETWGMVEMFAIFIAVLVVHLQLFVKIQNCVVHREAFSRV